MPARFIRFLFTLLVLSLSLSILLLPSMAQGETVTPSEAPTEVIPATTIPTAIPTATPIPTTIPTATPIPTELPSPTVEASAVPSETPTETATASLEAPVNTETATATLDLSLTPSETPSSSPTAGLTETPTVTATPARNGNTGSGSITTSTDLQPSTSWYEENHAYVTYSPLANWTLTNSAGATGGHYYNTTTLNATMSFTFYGRGFAIQRHLNSNAGTIQVCVDALPCTIVSNVATTAAWQPFWGTNLSLGVHQVVITNLQAKNFRPDAIYIYGDYTNFTEGSYEAETAAIQYDGIWTNVNVGTSTERRQSVSANAEFAFAFTGQQFSIVRHLAGSGNYSDMEVCVDTTCQTVTNTGATDLPLGQQRRANFGPYTEGYHIVTVRALGTLPINLDRIEIYNDSQEVLDVLVAEEWYEEDHPYLNYTGTWLWKRRLDLASNDAAMETSQTGASLQFRFEGTGFVLKRETFTGYGNIEICVDGTENCRIVSNVTSAQTWQHIYWLDNLAFGVHNVVITYQGGTRFGFDAVQIFNNPSRTPLPVGTTQQTSSDIHYFGTWTNQSNASASGTTYVQTTKIGSGVSFEFEGTHALVYRTTDTSDIEICVDGSCVTRQNLGINSWTTGLRLGPYPEGIHTVQIRSLSGNAFILDHVEVYSVTGTSSCLNLSSFATGATTLENANALYPNLTMTTLGGGSRLIRHGLTPEGFNSLGGVANYSIWDGIWDTNLDSNYNFTLSQGSFSAFNLWLLDYGDYNPYNATQFQAALVAYNATGQEITRHTLSFTHGTVSGDATTSYGNPGNYLFNVTGEGITQVKLEFSHNGNNHPTWTPDPQFAIAAVCFDPSPRLTVQSANASYVEDQAPVSVLTSADATYNDPTLTGAIITLTNPLDGALELLSATGTSNISVSSYDSTTGVLTLSGIDTLANYETVIASLKYSTSSQNPNTTARSIRIVLQDGTRNSAPVLVQVNVVAVNDAPQVSSADSLSYIEDSPALVLLPNAFVSDIEGNNIVSASITLLNHPDGALEQLSVNVGPTGITASSYDSSTGVLTLSGSSSLANYEFVLRSLSYLNSSQNPNTATRNLSIELSDGSVSTANFSFAVQGVNDAPILSHSDTAGFYEDNGAVALVPDILITDVDDTMLEGATITLENPYSTETLTISSSNPAIVVTAYNPTTGVLSLSGTASLADYEAAFASLSYNNLSQNPASEFRIVNTYITDGNGSDEASVSVLLIGFNDAAVISGTATSTSYVEDAAPLMVFESLSVSDVDNPNLVSARVTLLNPLDGVLETLAVNIAGTSITASYDSGTGVLTLSGSDTIAHYQTVLQSLSYVNASQNPNETSRNLEIYVDDGSEDSNTLSLSLNVQAVNDVPAIDLTSAEASYVEDTAPVSLISDLSLSDSDSSSVAGATVTITNLADGAAEILSVTIPAESAIIANYSNGVLSLTGSASHADYAAVLESLVYENSSQNPTVGTRNLVLEVTDGSDSSEEALFVEVVAVNDATSITIGSPANYVENTPAIEVIADIALADVDDTYLEGVLITLTNPLDGTEELLAIDALATGIIAGAYNPSAGTLALSGTATLADYQDVLRTLTYINNSENPDTTVRSITVRVDDGDSLSSQSITLTITAVNDAPVISGTVTSRAYVEDAEPLAVFSTLSVTDPDSTLLTGATIVLTNAVDAGESISVDEALATAGGITVDSSVAGTITLSGNSTVSNYQTILESLTYLNPSTSLTESARTITVAVSDGEFDSNTLSVNLNLIDIPEVAMNEPTPITRPVCEGNVTIGAGDTAGLITAINNANATPYLDTVICLTESTYLVNTVNNTTTGSNAFPVMSANITIVGNGATIEREENAPAMRFFYVDNTCGGEVAFYDLTLKNGSITGSEAKGGAIYANTRLLLVNLTAEGNSSTYIGGAVFASTAIVRITESHFINNSAAMAAGALYYYSEESASQLRVDFSHFEGNTAGFSGGAIIFATLFTYDTVVVIDSSSFIRNTADFGGGAIQDIVSGYADVLIANSLFHENQASMGGGAYNDSFDSQTQFVNSLFSSNTASSGGAIYIGEEKELLVSNNYFVNNSANWGGATAINYDSFVTFELNSFEANHASQNEGGGAIVDHEDEISESYYNATNNCFVGNTNVSVSGTHPNNLENNWWGADTGPNTTGADIVVGTSLDFTPWLSSAPACGLTALPAEVPAWNPPAVINTCYMPLQLSLINQNAAYFEGEAAVSGLVNAVNLEGSTPTVLEATISIENLLDVGSEILSVDVTGTAIVASYDAGTGILSLTGEDTQANYEAVISSLSYENTTESPTFGSRTIEISVSNGLETATATATVLLLEMPEVAMNEPTPIARPECDITVGASDTAGLITAINTANANAYVNTTICLTESTYLVDTVNNSTAGDNAFPVMSANISIVGNNATIERPDTAPAMRFFNVNNTCGGEVAFYDLTLKNGSVVGDGGAIYAATRIMVVNLTAESNTATVQGGAISLSVNAANSYISQSSFADNESVTGGAVYIMLISGNFRIDTSNFEGNTATSELGAGGALYMYGIGNQPKTVWLDSLTFRNNTAMTGGAIDQDIRTLTGAINISNSWFDNNHANLTGGAIDNSSPTLHRINISNTLFSNNYAGIRGGAIHGEYNQAVFTNDTFLGNTVDAVGPTSDINPQGGGAIFNRRGTIELSNFEGNYAQHGSAIYGNYITHNSCFSANLPLSIRQYHAGQSVIFDLENNWWGVSTGPNTEGGETVSTTLTDFDPWLTEAPACGLLTSPVSVPAWNPPAVTNSCYSPLVLDLDVIEATYLEDTAPVSLVSSATFTGSHIETVTITITNLLDGDDEQLEVTIPELVGISSSYVDGVLTLSTSSLGSASLADYESVLESLTYHNSSQDPDVTQRLINVAFMDSQGTYPAIQIFVNVETANDAPVIEGSSYSQIYFEDYGAIALFETLNLSDADDVNLESATFTLINLADTGNELITIDTALATSYGITLDTTVPNIITLTGSASIVHYQEVLLSIKYENTSLTMTETAREFTLVINDGELDSELFEFSLSLADIPTIAMNTPDELERPECDVTIAAADTAGLIAAIEDANAHPYEAVVICLTESTYLVNAVDNDENGATAFPVIGTNVTIVGDNAIIEREETIEEVPVAEMRFFYVDNICGGEVSFYDLTLKNGAIAGNGGAIYANTRVLLVNVTSDANTANPVAEVTNSGRGGAVYLSAGANYSRITESSFMNNTAVSGGAVAIDTDYESFELRLDFSEFENNTAENGGAISFAGSFVINIVFDSLTFKHNQATEMGGAISNEHMGSGNLYFLNTWFHANEAVWGAAYRDGISSFETYFTNSLFSSNRAAESGAAIYGETTASSFYIDNSHFINNEAGSSISSGGAIYIAGGNTLIEASNFELNRLGATTNGSAIFTDNAATVSNSCFAANQAISVYSATANSIAENNWWGVNTGPNTEGGDTVQTGISYTPWLTELPACGLTAEAVEAPEWIPLVAANECWLYTEDNNPLDIVDGSNISSTEDVINGFTIEISNLADGDFEILEVTIPEELAALEIDWMYAEGVLTLEGDATLAEYLSILESLTYINLSDTPDEETIRLIDIAIVVDEEEPVVLASLHVSVKARNDAPELNIIPTGTIYQEQAPAMLLATDVELSDPDNESFTTLTVTLTNHPNGASETLDFGTVAGLEEAHVEGSFVWTFTAPAITEAMLDQLLDTLTYSNSSDAPNTSNRLIEFVLNDGVEDSFVEILAVQIAAVNDAPLLYLDGAEINDSSTFSQSSLGVDIVNAPVISDIDGDQLSSITIEFTNRPDGANERLWIAGMPHARIVVQTTENGLRLFGEGSLDDYELVLANLYYQNSAANPNTSQRDVIIKAWQGETSSPIAHALINVSNDNSVPGIVLDSSQASINFATSFTVAHGAVSIVGLVDISDTNNTLLASATIEIDTDNGTVDTSDDFYDVGMEILSVNTTGTAITAVQSGRILTLTGVDTIANYEMVLNSLRYNHLDYRPNMTARPIRITVNDGYSNSNEATSTVSFTELLELPSAYVCARWDTNTPAAWQALEPGSIIWDGTGMYADTGLEPVTAYYNFGMDGPWFVSVEGSSTNFVLLAGDTLGSLEAVERDADGFYIVDAAYIALEWNYSETNNPVFSNLCYHRIEETDLTATYVDTTNLLVDSQTLEVGGIVSANVQNSGSTNISGSFDVLFFDDVNNDSIYTEGVDTVLGETEVTGLEAGETVTVYANAHGKVKFAGDLVYVFVDSSDEIIEVNENNNRYWAQCVEQE